MAVAYLQEHLLDKGGNLDLDLQNIVGLPKVLVDILFGAFGIARVPLAYHPHARNHRHCGQSLSNSEHGEDGACCVGD